MPRRSDSMLRRLGTALVPVLPGLITKGSLPFQHPTGHSPRMLGFDEKLEVNSEFLIRSTVNTPAGRTVRAEQLRAARLDAGTLEP